MKTIASTLLALFFVVYVLIALIAKNHTWDRTLVRWDDGQPNVSELGLRYNMQSHQ
jgi:hypothetical protein